MRIERTGSAEPLAPRISRFFIEALNGVEMDSIQSPQDRRIDYSCLRGLLAIELKTLEGDPSERTNNFVDELRDRPDFPPFFGAVPIEAMISNMDDPDRLRRLAIERIGRSIVTHLKKANDQLAAHERGFPRRNRLRVVVIVNEDHQEYDPQTVGWIIHREFQRILETGPRYSSIDAVLFFTERHATRVADKVVFPILTIDGPDIDNHPWKNSLLEHVTKAWATWNDSQTIESDEALSFDAVERIPDAMPRHEKWRLDYQRQPYLRPLSDEAFRDRFDEVMLLTMLCGIKGAPFQGRMDIFIAALEQFAHVQEEMHYRALPITKFPWSFHRQQAAALRLRLAPFIVEWLEDYEEKRHDIGDRK